MESRCFGEDYNTKFDPSWYLDTYYSKDSFFLKEGLSVQRLCELFSRMDSITDGKLLDFGCGPTIHIAAVASRVFDHITTAEYAKQNRDIVQKWLKKEEGAFDWSHFLSYIANWEQTSCDVIANRTRAAIKEVIPCDVSNDNILLTPGKGPFDFVISTLVLEAACGDISTYMKAIKNLCSLIKPGGMLYLNGMLGDTFYKVKDCKFFSLCVTEEDLMQAITGGGMKLESFDHTHIDELEEEYSDHKRFYFLLASKKA